MRRSLSLFSSLLLFSGIACAATIPSGTKLKVRIKDDSETLARGYQFHAELVDDVAVGDKVILPRGTAMVGERTEMQDSASVELTLIRRPEHDYPIVTSSVLVGGTNAAQQNQRRQQGMQSAVDAVRGAVSGRPADSPGSFPDTGAKGLMPEQILQFKLRKAVEIEEQTPKKKDVGLSVPK